MMWQRRKRNIFMLMAKAILIALVVVLIVRSFFVQSYSVTTSQMEGSLMKGDEIFVNKTAYGIRLPVTLLSIPFTFDRFLGRISYSKAIVLPYKRFFECISGRNDVIVYNNPSQIDKPLDKRDLLMGRCVGLPGDSISVSGNIYTINNISYSSSPDGIQLYKYPSGYMDAVNNLTRKLNIQMYNAGKVDDSFLLLQMSKYNAYIMNRNFSGSFDVLSEVSRDMYYNFVVPFRGMTIELTPENLARYSQAIMAEMENRAGIIDGRLMIDYKEQKSYTFTDNYYWIICDNVVNSVDSRKIGFIPQKSIIGRASFIWFSKDNRVGIRQNRCFTNVN